MSSIHRAAFAALLVLAAAAPSALAHGSGSVNYISKVTLVRPAGSGFNVDVLDRDDRLQVSNRGRSTVVIEGYNGEPYLRVRPDGTVEANRRSPAYYLNEDRFAQVRVPRSANAHARPRWRVVDHAGRVDWHDHRIHWMAKSRPGKVKDPDVRTKVFDWSVPIRADGRKGEIAGELYWVPSPGGSLPTGAIAAFAAFLLASGTLVILVRRRRSATPRDRGEAW